MPEMTARERYLAIMRGQSGVRTLYWEIGYWVATIERWYGEGLRRTSFAPPPGFGAGDGVFGGGMPFPHMPQYIRYRDVDVYNTIGMDPGSVRIPINWRLAPLHLEVVLEEEATTRVMISQDGIKVRVRKDNMSLPQYLEWPVTDMASWERVRAERFHTGNILERLPARWETIAATYKDRDYPLGLFVDGFFSLPRELVGVENQMMLYYTDPDLMRAITKDAFEVWMAVIEEVLSKTDIDFVYYWEDMTFKTGPLISPDTFREFCAPYYKKMNDFLRARGIDVIFVDTDGDCWLMIPEFLNCGVTGLLPMEVPCGMDIVKVRQQYPTLQIMGGLDKTRFCGAQAEIDAELEAKLPYMLKQGRFIPTGDHMIHPEVPWENFVYYRKRVREYIEKYQPGD